MEICQKVTAHKNVNGTEIKLIAASQLFCEEPSLECYKFVNGCWVWVETKAKPGMPRGATDYIENYRPEVYKYFSPVAILTLMSKLGKPL